MITVGDARHLPFADGIAQTCVTSPPYFGLRDYGTAQWVGGNDPSCQHIAPLKGGIKSFQTGNAGSLIFQHTGTCPDCGAVRQDAQIGMELTVDEYVAGMVGVMREVWRVLRDDGTLWLNLGDTYASAWACNRRSTIGAGSLENGKRDDRPNRLVDGLKEKDLIGIPWRVAFALQADGWYLRSDIIWAKPNPMPESVTDRPTKAHEYVFLLAKQERYFYDAEAIKESASEASGGRQRAALRGTFDYASSQFKDSADVGNGRRNGGIYLSPYTGSRNARSVWQITTQPYSGAHFATMPPALVRRCIMAGSSARGQCPECGQPWRPIVETEREFRSGSGRSGNMQVGKNGPNMQGGGETPDVRMGPTLIQNVVGWQPTCECGHAPVPQIVLDPFMGSGTTAKVAIELGRLPIGVDLNASYVRDHVSERTTTTIGMGI